MRSRNFIHLRFLIPIILTVAGLGVQRAWTQETPRSVPIQRKPRQIGSMQRMQQQLRELQRTMDEMRADAIHYHAQASAEILGLKQQLQDTQQKLDSMEHSLRISIDALQAGSENKALKDSGAGNQAVDGQQRDHQLQKLQEDQQLLAAKVDEQYQTKVETASKYRLKLSGILLANFFSVKGNVEQIETPALALPRGQGGPSGSFGGSIRQSQLGFETYGPTIAGARTRADLVVDLFGGFSDTVNGFTAGTLRMRTGAVRLDWDRTSLIAGQDELFFSPVYPTSFASVATPPLAYSGNLYGWLPQIRIEHRLAVSQDSTLTLSAGILDPLTGEAPSNDFLRTPGAGESARQPAYGTGVAWSRKVFGQPFTLGAGGYYSRQNWGFNRTINGWAGTVDWNVPLGGLFSLSGKFYDGQAIGGLGAGIARSALFTGSLADPATRVNGLHSTGGWAQFKFKPFSRLEFNTAAGQDGANAADVRGFPVAPISYFGANANLTRNRSEFANVIYRPRSNLLFSTEFRTIRTFSINGTSQRANQLNFITGVFF
jgi:hypothetical protein